MIGFSRRQFATSLAAAGLSLNALVKHAAAQAAASPATRNLPRTYSGKTLRIVWGNSPAFISTAEFSKEFTAATGVAKPTNIYSISNEDNLMVRVRFHRDILP